MNVLRAVVDVAVRPRRASRTLLGQPHALRTGLIGFLLVGAMYTFTVFWAWRNGFGAAAAPWVPIPAEDYYFWEMFFAVPVFAVVLVVFAGVTQLLADAFGGRGRFEDVVALLALAVVLPVTLLMWLPETLLMVAFPDLRATELGGFAGVPRWLDAARQLAVPLWTLAVGTLTVAEAHRIAWPKALLAVLAGVVPAALLALTWIR